MSTPPCSALIDPLPPQIKQSQEPPSSEENYADEEIYAVPELISAAVAYLSMASVGQPLLQPADSPSDTDASSSGTPQKEEEPTPWPSVYMCGFCAVIQAAQFSIYFSSMWPYLISLDPLIPETMLGYIISMYSLAQCISAPVFGFWSNRIEQVRIPMIAAFCLMMLGNFLYLCVQFVPISAVPFVMILARFTTGSGTGNATLLRTYVASASTLKDRARSISTVTGGIAVGTMFGPALQLIFTPLGIQGFFLGPFRFNIYTAPAAFAILMNVAGLFLIAKFFEEKRITYESTKTEVGGKTIGLDKIALGLCAFTRYAQIFTVTTIETIGSPYTMMMFSLDKVTAVAYNSGVHAAAGIIGTIFYVTFMLYDFTKYIPERISCISSQFTLLLMFIVTFSYPFFGSQIGSRVNGSDTGCDFQRFDWCEGLTTTSPWIFYGFYVLVFGLAFSFLNISMTTLFSKMIGSRKQGTLQGVFQLCGSMGRLTAPLSMSWIYSLFGPRIVWSTEISLIALVIVAWYLFYGRMIPFADRVEKKSQAADSKI